MDKYKPYSQVHRARNRSRYKKWDKDKRERRRAAGLCTMCGVTRFDKTKVTCESCRAKLHRSHGQSRHPAAIPRIQKENAPLLEEFLDGLID